MRNSKTYNEKKMKKTEVTRIPPTPNIYTFLCRVGFYYQGTTTGPILIIINPFDSPDFPQRFKGFRSYRVLSWRGNISMQEASPDNTSVAIIAPFYQSQVEVASAPITPPASFSQAAELVSQKSIFTNRQNPRSMQSFFYNTSRFPNSGLYVPIPIASVSDAYFNTGLIGYTDGTATYQLSGYFIIEFKDIAIL